MYTENVDPDRLFDYLWGADTGERLYEYDGKLLAVEGWDHECLEFEDCPRDEDGWPVEEEVRPYIERECADKVIAAWAETYGPPLESGHNPNGGELGATWALFDLPADDYVVECFIRLFEHNMNVHTNGEITSEEDLCNRCEKFRRGLEQVARSRIQARRDAATLALDGMPSVLDPASEWITWALSDPLLDLRGWWEDDAFALACSIDRFHNGDAARALEMDRELLAGRSVFANSPDRVKLENACYRIHRA